MRLTEKNARDYVLILERKGYLRRQPNVARGITLLRQPTIEPLLEIPLIGRVMAGKPVEVFENHEPILVPPMLLRAGTHFVMEVQGDSMIEDGIREGDLVIVQQQLTPNNGDTVVAVVHGEATIKRFYRRGPIVELRPANAQMTALQVDAAGCRGQGRCGWTDPEILTAGKESIECRNDPLSHGMAMATFRGRFFLGRALFCVECEIIFTGCPRCPRCTSGETVWPLSEWFRSIRSLTVAAPTSAIVGRRLTTGTPTAEAAGSVKGGDHGVVYAQRIYSANADVLLPTNHAQRRNYAWQSTRSLRVFTA